MKLFQIFADNHASLHCAWVNAGTPVHMHTCTMISKVSRIIMLASVARLPSISASCSSSALVLQSRKQKALTHNDYDTLTAYERLECGFQSCVRKRYSCNHSQFLCFAKICFKKTAAHSLESRLFVHIYVYFMLQNESTSMVQTSNYDPQKQCMLIHM